jgi:purine-binding chemotaxis protein CheW
MEMNEKHHLQNGSRRTQATVKGSASEYLVFMLGAEHYAIDIRAIQEIRSYSHVTHIANAPEHIKGIFNLRGVVVPILDLRIRFGNHSPTYNDQTIVIILTALDRVMGVVVDAVSDVVEISADDMMPPPQLGTAALTGYIVGIASQDERMLIVLDIEGVLSDEDTQQLDLAATENLC